MFKKILGAGGAVLFAAAALTACTSDADMASENLSTAAEQFEIQRRITVVNSITDKVVFEVEGRCSIEMPAGRLEVTCKHADNDLRKHFVGLGDNTTYLTEQLEPIAVDVYRTRIIIKPETVIPDPDLETSGDVEKDG